MSKYKALVAPADGLSAASRLTNPSGAKWVRLDGVEAAPTAADMLDSKFETSLELTARGRSRWRAHRFTGTGACRTHRDEAERAW